MNDLMTKSFLSYVDLKKQAMKDLETQPDIEMGQFDPSEEANLSGFFKEVEIIKADMEEINNLLLDLQGLNEETKKPDQSAKILRGLRDRISSDKIAVLKKAKVIKTRLESLDKSDVDSRDVNQNHIRRTRIAVTNGLRVKLKEMMNDFQSLRERLVLEHKQGYQTVEKSVSGDGLVTISEGNGQNWEESLQRHEAVKDIQRSLVELHQVFLDMAVMVETQGEKMNNIEENVVSARGNIEGGTKELDQAKRMKSRRSWACWIGVVVLVLLLVCLVAMWF